MRWLQSATVLIVVLIGLFPTAGVVSAHDGEVGQIHISSIGLDSPVVSLGWKEFFENGVKVRQPLVDSTRVGWHERSARPGQGDNIVLNGHSNIGGRVFQDLWRVKVGDEVVLHWGDEEFAYTVTQRLLLREKGVSFEQRVENANLILPTGYERLTLVTCYGQWAEYRLIIIAEPYAVV
jgi:sortase A